MPVQRYRFHCVGPDGDAILDLTGRWVARRRLVGPQAGLVVRALVAATPGTDWAGWHVEAYDARGVRVYLSCFSQF